MKRTTYSKDTFRFGVRKTYQTQPVSRMAVPPASDQRRHNSTIDHGCVNLSICDTIIRVL